MPRIIIKSQEFDDSVIMPETLNGIRNTLRSYDGTKLGALFLSAITKTYFDSIHKEHNRYGVEDLNAMLDLIKKGITKHPMNYQIDKRYIKYVIDNANGGINYVVDGKNLSEIPFISANLTRYDLNQIFKYIIVSMTEGALELRTRCEYAIKVIKNQYHFIDAATETSPDSVQYTQNVYNLCKELKTSLDEIPTNAREAIKTTFGVDTPYAWKFNAFANEILFGVISMRGAFNRICLNNINALMTLLLVLMKINFGSQCLVGDAPFEAAENVYPTTIFATVELFCVIQEYFKLVQRLASTTDEGHFDPIADNLAILRKKFQISFNEGFYNTLETRIAEIFDKHPYIGRRDITHAFLGENSLLMDAGVWNFDTVIRKEKLVAMHKAITDIRGSDTDGSYNDFVKSIPNALIQMRTQFVDWYCKKPSDGKHYIDFINVLGREFDEMSKSINATEIFTPLFDASEFGKLTTFACDCKNNHKFAGEPMRAVRQVLDKVYILYLMNARIKDERTLNWSVDNFKFFNAHISYFAMHVCNAWFQKYIENYPYGLVNALNAMVVAKYRCSQTPNFKAKKEGGVVAPMMIGCESFEEYPDGHESYRGFITKLKKIIEERSEAIHTLEPDKHVNAVVKYLGDALSNNAMNAEYAILILMTYFDSQKYKVTKPFSKLIRYVISLVGGRHNKVFTKFRYSEINREDDIFDIHNTTTDDDEDRMKILEDNIEFIVLISILQRVRFNLRFAKRFENIADSTCPDIPEIVDGNPHPDGDSYSSRRMVGAIGGSNTYPGDLIYTENFIPEEMVDDIENACAAFDQMMTYTGADNNWFAQHKDLVITGSKEDHIKKPKQPDAVQTVM